MLWVIGIMMGYLLVLSGCASMASLASTMNERQIQSCVYWAGFVGGALSGGHAQVKGITATGGVPLTTCIGDSHAN